MSVTNFDTITSIGNIADGDALLAERITGTTVRVTFNGVAITKLGTINTGTWNGSIIGLQYGGSGANLTASNGGIIYSTATTMAVLNGTATANQILLSGASGAPVWSTSTIPSSAGSTANKVLLSNGTNYALSTPTFPNASATTRKIIVSDGTNWTASTETYAVPGTSGNIMQSDGTNWTSVSTSSTPTPNTLASWDANSNLSSINLLDGYATTVTAGGTNTLTVASKKLQYFTGSTTQLVVMPVVSTLVLGQTYILANLSTGNVSVASSGVNTILTLSQNTYATLICTAITGTTAASWNYTYQSMNSATTPTVLGGTGLATMTTAYAPVCAGTTATGALQVASTGMSTSGWVLTSTGASSLPTFQAPAASSTYPTAWVAYTPTFTAFGTVSSVQIWSRKLASDTLQIRGVFTSGTSTATEARMTLGFNGVDSSITSSGTNITSIQYAGPGALSTTGALLPNILIEASKGYLTFGIQASGNSGLTKVNGSSILASGSSLSFMAEIPI